MRERWSLGRPRLLVAAMSALLAACASTPEAPPAGGSITYQEQKGLGVSVWVAPGFDFSGFDAVYIAPTVADVPKMNPDGWENLEWAKGVLAQELAAAFRARNLLGRILTHESEVPPGARVLRLDNTIIEYEKGGGAARYFAGLYGAGQPVIKVRGRMSPAGTDPPLFQFEARRSGDSFAARVSGAHLSDKAIQEEDIRDLAQDLAEYIARTAGKTR